MSKDPAMISSGYERLENDAYYTRDIVCMDALMWGIGDSGLVSEESVVWEPFAGGGHITNFLQNRDITVLSTDINPQSEMFLKNDYLENPNYGFQDGRVKMVVTNPPFEKSFAEKFVRDMVVRCDDVPDFTAAILLRNEWDSAGTRLDIFDSVYFNRKIVITQRPKWTKITKDSKSPRHNYSWFIFSNNRMEDIAKIMHYHPSQDSKNYEKVGRKYKRKYPEAGLDYIY